MITHKTHQVLQVLITLMTTSLTKNLSQETRKILTALRDDLFINDLAVEYNTLFFTGLRKVLSEQTYVDWMFKTSFINAKNSVRQLDQRKTYTTGTDSWIESYINEVKPFHTKLRKYKLGTTRQRHRTVYSQTLTIQHSMMPQQARLEFEC